MGKRKYSDSDYKYIIENYNLKTSTEIAKIVGCSRSLVTKIWNDNSLKGKQKSRQYYCDFNYFNNIDTRNKSYLVGLLASDGCLFKRENHQGCIRLSLHKDDLNLLKDINSELQYDKPLEQTGDYLSITINSEIMYSNLVSIGLYDNKTKYLDSKDIIIPDAFLLDYIRGYFDGDGSIFINKPKSNINITPTCFYISISGYYHNLKSIQNMLLQYNIVAQITIDKRRYGGYNKFANLKFGANKDKYFFLKLIYHDVNKILYMNRK